MNKAFRGRVFGRFVGSASRSARNPVPSCEDLEGRQLLSTATGPHGAAGAATVSPSVQVARDYRQLNRELHSLAARSHVTVAEFALHESDSALVLNAPLLQQNPNDQNLLSLDIATGQLIDGAFVDGGLDAQGWASVRSQLTADLAGLGYDTTQAPPDQILSDMQQVAQSAGVTQAQSQTVQLDMARLATDEAKLNVSHYPSAELAYVQSLRSFVHGKR